jgi:hypothetical protein
MIPRMEIYVDFASVPPKTTLRDPEDFSSFKVVVDQPEHVFVTVDDLARMAGARADDPAWREQLDGMLGYARSKGWTRDADGAIQAHVEWRT